jgi:hypothetical protein
LSAALWWIDRGATAETFDSHDQRSAQATGRGTARDQFSRGKSAYLAGDYRSAANEFESALSRRGELSESERQLAEEYLARARAKRDAQAPAGDAVARGQSAESRFVPSRRTASVATAAPNGGDADAEAPDARKLLAQARQEFNRNNIAAAEKLALECQKLGMKPRMFGDSPDRLLEDIKESKRQAMLWRKDSTSNDAKRNRSNYMLQRARQMIEEGDYAQAERTITTPSRCRSIVNCSTSSLISCASRWRGAWRRARQAAAWYRPAPASRPVRDSRSAR